MIKNKKGSTLMLAILVLTVISILGLGMLTLSMYSQNETNLEIDEQKAYYAAKSAVDATVKYIEAVDGNLVQADIGTGQYKDSTFKVEIQKSGDNEIVVIGTGTHNGKSKVVKAQLKREPGKNIFNQNVVFGAKDLQITNIKMLPTLNDQGEILEDYGQIYIQGSNSYINKLETTMPIYIQSDNFTGTIGNSILEDLYIELKGGGITINNNPSIKNVYINLKDRASNITFNNNTIKDTAYINAGQANMSISGNTLQDSSMLLKVNRAELWGLQANFIKNLYIQGAQKINTFYGESESRPIENVYTDAKEIFDYRWCRINNIMQIKTEEMPPEINTLETQTTQAIGKFSALHTIFNESENNKWPTPGIGSIEPIITSNTCYTEYYYPNSDPDQEVRLVMLTGAYDLHVKLEEPSIENTRDEMYYMPRDHRGSRDNKGTVIFVENNNRSILFEVEQEDKLESVYVYAPMSMVSFSNYKLPASFKGSIIAKWLLANGTETAAPSIFQFQPLPDLSETGINIPSIGGGNYYFQKYIE